MLVGIRQQGQKACAAYRELQQRLIMRARARDAARDDRAGLSDIALERRQILVIDLLDVIGGEPAKLLATEKTCPVVLLLPYAHRHGVIVALVAELIAA